MTAFTCRRITLTEAPFGDLDAKRGCLDQGLWPASWITHPSLPAAPCRMVFRLKLTVTEAQQVRLHVAGDERYELQLNDQSIGWGSERGAVEHWSFDSYDLVLEPGEHLLTANVLAAGPHGLRSQMTVSPAFLLASETPGFSTGEAPWEVRLLHGLSYEKPFPHDFFSVGWNTVHEAARMSGDDAAWAPAHRLHAGSTAGIRNRMPRIHLLAPAVLPVAKRDPFAGGRVRHLSRELGAMVQESDHLADEATGWDLWWKLGQGLTLPPNQRRKVLLDLEDYVCAWPELETSGGQGSSVKVFWAESLFEVGGERKGNRAQINGKIFQGVGDTFLPDGADSTFHGPFIRAGRYLQLTVMTGAHPLVLKGLRLRRAEYPLEITSRFTTEHPATEGLIDRCQRTFRASCHDYLIDGPYYEQMGWIGDMLQMAVILYTLTPDTRLLRKVLADFDDSRLPDGLIRARWPARDSLVLPPYALSWIHILHGFAWWRDEADFVRERLPGMRAILDRMLAWVDREDGLLRIPTGWNFVDWVSGWEMGIPPRDPDGSCGVLQWQLARALQQAAELEEAFGEPELAARYRRQAGRVAQAAEVFWDEARGLYADTRARTSFCEHAQAYGVLSGHVPVGNLARIKTSLVSDPDLTRSTNAHSHHLFEAYVQLGLGAALWARLGRWLEYDELGLLTTPETPEPTRSDCHAWSSHPHYHLYASLLGIRPAAPGFHRVRITPRLPVDLGTISGVLPHPQGEIRFQVGREGDILLAQFDLPGTLEGECVWEGQVVQLTSGNNILRLPVSP